MSIPVDDTRILWAYAGDRCTLCQRTLVTDQTAAGDPASVIGEEVRIITDQPNSKRHGVCSNYDAYDNLILLCANDSATVNNQPLRYTIGELRTRKAQHEAQVEKERTKAQRRRTRRALGWLASIAATVIAILIGAILTNFFGLTARPSSAVMQPNNSAASGTVKRTRSITQPIVLSHARHFIFVIPSPPVSDCNGVMLSNGKVYKDQQLGNICYAQDGIGRLNGQVSLARAASGVGRPSPSSCDAWLRRMPLRFPEHIAPVVGDAFCAQPSAYGVGYYLITDVDDGRVTVEGTYWPGS